MSRHKPQTGSQAANAFTGCLLSKREEEEREEEETETPPGAQGKVNRRLLFFLLLLTQKTPAAEISGWLRGLQEAWQLCCWLGTESPQGQVPGLEWLLCTQNNSLRKALVEVSSRKAAPSKARPLSQV